MIITINSERGSILEQNTNTTPWEVNLLPAFAKETGATAQTIRLPVSFSAGLTAAALASYFMGRRIAKTKPAEILRRL